MGTRWKSCDLFSCFTSGIFRYLRLSHKMKILFLPVFNISKLITSGRTFPKGCQNLKSIRGRNSDQTLIDFWFPIHPNQIHRCALINPWLIITITLSCLSFLAGWSTKAWQGKATVILWDATNQVLPTDTMGDFLGLDLRISWQKCAYLFTAVIAAAVFACLAVDEGNFPPCSYISFTFFLSNLCKVNSHVLAAVWNKPPSSQRKTISCLHSRIFLVQIHQTAYLFYYLEIWTRTSFSYVMFYSLHLKNAQIKKEMQFRDSSRARAMNSAMRFSLQFRVEHEARALGSQPHNLDVLWWRTKPSLNQSPACHSSGYAMIPEHVLQGAVYRGRWDRPTPRKNNFFFFFLFFFLFFNF